MSKVGACISEAARRLRLRPDQFRMLPSDEARVMASRMLETFTRSASGFPWESFRIPSASVQVSGDHGWEVLDRVVPDADCDAYLVVDPGGDAEYLVYACSARHARDVIGECTRVEYYLVDRGFTWVVCENHHEFVVGSGPAAVASLREFAESRGLVLWEGE